MCPVSVEDVLLIQFLGFGSRRDTKIFMEVCLFPILCGIRNACNARLFRESSLYFKLLNDRVIFLASFLPSASGLLEVSL